MASNLLGRVPCVEPNCNFPSAHIKVNVDVEGKRPYRHCPECGAQFFPRNQQQVRNMMSTMRTETQSPAPAPVPAPAAAPELKPPAKPAAKQDPVPDPVPEQRYQVVFGVKVPV